MPTCRSTYRPNALSLIDIDGDAVIDVLSAGQHLVILASSDSDLAPALDEVVLLGTAKVETCCWYDIETRVGYQLHPTDRSTRIWNTRLPETAFCASWDLTKYT